MSDIVTKLSQALTAYNDQVNKLKKELSAITEAEIKNISLEIFKLYPDLVAFGWTQYTPYFNDGDPCVFRVNDLQFTDKEEDLDDEDSWEYGFYGDYKDKFKVLQELADCLGAADDILLNLFGDHAFIRVTRDGLEVNEYDHD